MAAIRFGGVVADARGAIGDVVYSRNRGGAFARSKGINPQTPSVWRDKAQEILGQVATRWRDTLTDEQRGAWEAFAGWHLGQNRLGDAVRLSGVAMYEQVNYRLHFCAESWLDDPPGTWQAPIVGDVVFEVIYGDPQVFMQWRNEPTMPADCGAYVKLTRVVDGTRRVQWPDYVCMNLGANNLFPNGYDLSQVWCFRFNQYLVDVGARIGACVQLVNRVTGAASIPWVGETRCVLPL